MKQTILAINPGSTSTKVAVYEERHPLLTFALSHSAEELAPFATVVDQFSWRKELILKSLKDHNFDLHRLTAVIGRGGLIHPVEGGVYEVNACQVEADT